MNKAALDFRQIVAEGSYVLAAAKVGPYVEAFELAFKTCTDDASRILLIEDARETLAWATKLALIGRAQIEAELDRLPGSIPYNTAKNGAQNSNISWTLDG
jgi:hypothetical protein